MDKGFFLRLCKYLLRRERKKKKKRKTPEGCFFSLSAVIFSADGSASMPSRSASQKWKVISSICGHSTLRGSLVTVQKNFIYFQACSCLSKATRSGMKKGRLRTAPQPQHCRQLTASCCSLFRNSWSFLKCFLSFWKSDWSIYSNCVFAMHTALYHWIHARLSGLMVFFCLFCFFKWIKIFFKNGYWLHLFPHFLIYFLV